MGLLPPSRIGANGYRYYDERGEGRHPRPARATGSVARRTGSDPPPDRVGTHHIGQIGKR
ncbi:hypothetical protein [Nocardia carnea]|uniref:hypothetical protein n=1 Tax=Nocardia carnea TaxID=37328 RepID=UPI003D7AADEF